MAALEGLERAYAEIRHDPRFWAEFRELLATYAGRPTPIYRADRLAARRSSGPAPVDPVVRSPAAPPPALPEARGPRPHRRAQDQQRPRPGAPDPPARQGPGDRRDRRRPARRRDRHRLRAARPAVRRVHGRRGHRRQQPNVLRMRALGAEVRPVTCGTATLKDAVNEAMRDWVTNVETTHYVLGSAMGPHPYPTIVRDLQRVHRRRGRGPGRRGRGPAARPRARLRRRRLERDRAARPVHRRAVGPARGRRGRRRRHRDRPPCGGAGRRDAGHPPRQPLDDAPGRRRPGRRGHSISAGLDYPGVGPQIAALVAAGRLELAAATDAEALDGDARLSPARGSCPRSRRAHAFVVLPGCWPATRAG